jgi:predicted phage terminase large subunit-like protein
MTINPWATDSSWKALVANRARTHAIVEQAQRELRRKSLLEFVKGFVPYYKVGWFHKELCDTLDAFIEAVERNKEPRLIIEVPPRHGKSEIVSRHFPPFILGHHPDWEVVTATYGQSLSDKMGKYVRNVLNDPYYQTLFPDTAPDNTSNSVNFVGIESTRGSYTSVGVGGGLAGMGAHVLIIDDPHKDRQESDSARMREAVWDWYSGVARNRLAPGGGIIVLQTRWHEDDLAGHLQRVAKENPDADQWHVIKYPAVATQDEAHRKSGEALHPARYPIEALNRIKASSEPRDWTAQFQQNPVPDEGIFFTKEMLDKTWFDKDEKPKNLNNYLSVDLAIGEEQTSDYTVIAPFGICPEGAMWFHDDFTRFRGNTFEIVERILDLAKKYDCRHLTIERGHISKAIEPVLAKRMRERGEFYPIWSPVPHRDKQYRASPLQARMAQGMVRFPKGNSLFTTEVAPELLGFPATLHDDCVDALSWCAQFIHHHVGASNPSAPPPSGPEEGTFAWYQKRAKLAEQHRKTRNRRRTGEREIKHLNGRSMG